MVNTPEPIQIACAADARYLPHAAVMLHSLWWHNRGTPIRVNFLHGPGLPPRQKRQLEQMLVALGFSVHWIEIDDARVADLPSHLDYISRVVWYRVFMPELLPDLDRVLYLDCDVVAMDSIAQLWSLPLHDQLFAAATNIVPAHFSERAAGLGLPGPEHYFNLGVALWNLERMRAERFIDQVVRFSRDNSSRLLWMEQDAINALYWKRRLPLHPRWNCQNGIFFNSWGMRLIDAVDAAEALKNPALLHFEGGSFAKPWHYLSNHPLRAQYLFHRARTPWPLRVPEGVTLKNVLKKHLPEPALRLLRRVGRG